MVFGSTAEGVYNLYALNLSKGETFKITKEPPHLYAKTSRISPYVVYTLDVSKGFELVKLYAINLNTLELVDVSREVPPQRVVGVGFDGVRVAWSGSTKEAAGIYLTKVPDGEPELIAKTKGREFVTDVSGNYIVGFGHLRDNPYSMEIFVIDLKSNEFKVVTPKEGSTNTSPRIKDNDVFFVSDFKTLDKERLYSFNVSSEEFKDVTFESSDLIAYDPTEIVNYGWSDAGELWVIGKRDGRTKLFLNGREIPTPKGFITDADLYEGKAYIAFSSLKEPPKIASVDLTSGEVKVVIDNKLPEEISKKFGEVLFVRFRSFDGLEIPTYVLKNAEVSAPGPTVIYPHGGPWSEVADSWSSFIAALTVLGYHVVAPNFRGSTGYGESFRKLDLGDPGGGDLLDVVYARDWAVKAGIAREDSVCIVGYSYGGYMTFIAMTKYPDLWRCGVAGAGVTDWREDYELADAYFKKFDEILFAGKLELFEERSPITYVENTKAPICIIHPQNDSRCPLKPVMKFAFKLMELGKPFELHVVPEIGHAISLDNKSLLKFFIYTGMFLKKHLT
ncbi:MAG: hypothetical protein B7O98_04450 [Zestosphaera tikiterensis]|uniref:Uncharacterized protein n=1 Tax=Zestosphaera tikiterensis TaxID=1973259 RepID=A0A2R7Y807_9CREN|nr:MAG: hypothetical protein B7O98_04450 [Zestosphaera tikiterensis]